MVSGISLAAFFVWAVVDLSGAVKINRLRVPELVRYGSEAILDCDFSLDDRESDLVLKWHFNKSLVYQWIPSIKKRPQSLGILKDRVNLEYKASADINTIHRALHIVKTGPDLSGDYTCSVSTLESEDRKTKAMLVLVPEKFFELKRLKADEGSITVQCRAEGIFPEPEISIYSQQRAVPEAAVESTVNGTGLYEIRAQVTLPELDKPEEFACQLRIPRADYTTRRETVFYPGLATIVSVNQWLTMSMVLISCYPHLHRFGIH